MGARKIVVFGLGPIGCTPTEIARFGTNGKPCVDSINDVINLFNVRLKPLVNDLNNKFSDAKFTFINVTVSPLPTQTGEAVVHPFQFIVFSVDNFRHIYF